MSSYVGISSKARALSKIYVGVGGKAREVTKAYVGVGNKAREFYSGGRYIKDIAEGTTINVLESGTLTPFVVAKHNYESGLNGNGKHLLIRTKLLADKRSFSGYNWSTETNVRPWLSSTYAGRLDASFKTHIATVSYYYRGYTMQKTLTGQQYFILSRYDSLPQATINTLYASLGTTAFITRDTYDEDPSNSDNDDDYYGYGYFSKYGSTTYYNTSESRSRGSNILPCFCVDNTAQEAL